MGGQTKVREMLGLDRAVGFGLLAQFWNLISTPGTILLVATFFSPAQQGFYYTFGSLLALQIFFEMGLMTVISQFVSHEFVSLHWTKDGAPEGEEDYYHRLKYLLEKSFQWYALAGVLLFILLVPVGLLFFDQSGGSGNFAWRIPWALAVLGTALNLLCMPFLAVVMGSGEVAEVNRVEVFANLVGIGCLWIVMVSGGGLYSLGALVLGKFMLIAFYLVRARMPLLRIVISRSQASGMDLSFSWWADIWPMQWRIAVSWMAGYFVFQLFNPVLFHFQGAVAAGQMGMTLAASNALLGCALTWMVARSPDFGKFVARREWNKLDLLFFRTCYQNIGIALCGAVAGWGLLWVGSVFTPLGQRFISANLAGILFCTVVFQVGISNMATYLRAHKKEPLVGFSFFMAILQGAATWWLGRFYGVAGVVWGYFLITSVVAAPLAFFIWRHYRRQWHKC